MRKRTGLGCSAFARHYLRNHCCFLFPRLLRCFTSSGIALKPYVFRLQWCRITGIGFPHSDISGSKRVCRSPKLIAAYHVLHRLLMPRHPLCALSNLTKHFLVLPLPEHKQFVLLLPYAIVKEQSAQKGPSHWLLVIRQSVFPTTNNH